MNYLLSVIVPVYNAKSSLRRCVDSIISQSYRNLEIILVDDGSSDNSGKMCDEYAEHDSRIRVIHKTNGGVSSARNAGLDAAMGDFVAFVDSDDYIAPEMYEKLFCALPSDRGISVCDCYLHYQDKDVAKVIYNVCHESRARFLCDFLLSDIGGSCWNMIVPASLAKSFRFPEYMSVGEDLWFVLRLFVNADKIEKVNEPLYYYDQCNSSSITHTMSDEQDMMAVRGLAENKEYLSAFGLFEDCKKAWSWSVLRYKTTFVFTPKRLWKYRSMLPEANSYVSDCPLLSGKVKMLMKMLNCHLDLMVVPIVLIFRLKKCVMHI